MSETTLHEPAIEIRGLTVRYGKNVGVEGVDLVVGRGQSCGLVGPNGAGKSTTMKVLATLRRPDAGSVRVLGFDAASEADWVRWHVGFMPDVFTLPDSLGVMDYLGFAAAAHALEPGSRAAAVDAVLQLTDLTAHRDKTLGALSKGMRQRVLLARTLLPEPDILILDEPASGLDPRARIELRELLKELQRMGRTLLISSHVLSDLSDVCDSLAIMEEGRTVLQGSIAELQARLSPQLVVLVEATSDAEALAAALRATEGVSEVGSSAGRVRFRWAHDRAELAELLASLSARGHRYCAVEVEKPDVEDVFLSFTKGVTS